MQLAAPRDGGHHLPQGRDGLPLTGIQALQVVGALPGQYPVTVGAALQAAVVEHPELAIGLLHVDLDGGGPQGQGEADGLEGILRGQATGPAVGDDLHHGLLL